MEEATTTRGDRPGKRHRVAGVNEDVRAATSAAGSDGCWKLRASRQCATRGSGFKK